MNPRLYELAEKYHSDKLWWHSYIPMYDRLFESMTIPVRRLLEIGIGERGLMQPFLPEGVEYCHGSSLKMFRDFFPEAHIYGADIRQDVLFEEERIHTMLVNQSNEISLLNLANIFRGGFDVIIDDGSHLYSDQQTTLRVLL